MAIPKASGNGTRQLTLLELLDRVVQRAAVQILQPLLDPLFHDFSLGFRPNRGREHALARAEALAVQQDRWCWFVEDLRTAFDNIPQRRLLDVVRHYLSDAKLMNLIERIVLTVKGRGVRQGGALSPLLLNVYLHHQLDAWWLAENPGVPLIRVADDLLALCTSHDAAHRLYDRLKALLVSIAMPAKNGWDAAVRNLQGRTHAEWLGYRLRRCESGLFVEIGARAWSALEQHLMECHAHSRSPFRAREVVRGWIDQLGPAYPQADRDGVYQRLTRLAHDAAFEELPSFEELDQVWNSAKQRWEVVRAQTAKTLQARSAGTAPADNSAAAPATFGAEPARAP